MFVHRCMCSVQCVVSLLRDSTTSSIWILWGTTTRGRALHPLGHNYMYKGSHRPVVGARRYCHDLCLPKLTFPISFDSYHLYLNMEILVFSGKMFKTSPVVYIKLWLMVWAKRPTSKYTVIVYNIRKLKPSLNMQTDSIRTKVFTWRTCDPLLLC